MPHRHPLLGKRRGEGTYTDGCQSNWCSNRITWKPGLNNLAAGGGGEGGETQAGARGTSADFLVSVERLWAKHRCLAGVSMDKLLPAPDAGPRRHLGGRKV